MWKVVIQAEGASLPVKRYPAVQDGAAHFNIVDERSMRRVRQRMVNPETNQEVAAMEIRKGYQAAPGELVLLNDEELATLRPPASRDIHVVQFVKAATLAPQWYSRPYYLGPDQNAKDYFRSTLAEVQAEAIALALIAHPTVGPHVRTREEEDHRLWNRLPLWPVGVKPSRPEIRHLPAAKPNTVQFEWAVIRGCRQVSNRRVPA